MREWIGNVNTWLSTSSPPVSYKVEIAYIDAKEKHEKRKYSIDETYRYKHLSWIDMPQRFISYSRANAYAIKNYTPILYRISGSNNPPNYFNIDVITEPKPGLYNLSKNK